MVDCAFDSLGCETILPSQFFARKGAPQRQTGEHRLMLAVLEDAVNIYCNPRSTHRGVRAMREIEQWFASRDVSHPFSFERVCQALDLSIDYVRRGVRQARLRRHVAPLHAVAGERLSAVG